MFDWLSNLLRRKPNRMQLFPFPVKITRYGYPKDECQDSNTAKGIGCSYPGHPDNKLDSMSLAVSPDVELQFSEAGIKPGKYIRLYFSPAVSITRRWDDRTSNTLHGRCDLYCPKDEMKSFDGRPVIGFQLA